MYVLLCWCLVSMLLCCTMSITLCVLLCCIIIITSCLSCAIAFCLCCTITFCVYVIVPSPSICVYAITLCLCCAIVTNLCLCHHLVTMLYHCHHHRLMFVLHHHLSPSKDYLKVYIPNAITSILHTIVSHCCLRMTQIAVTNQNNLSLIIMSFHHHNRLSSLSFKKDTR
jgi:hypothetical protein